MRASQKWGAAYLIVGAFFTTGCGDTVDVATGVELQALKQLRAGKSELVTGPELEALKKLRTGTFELVARDDLEKLRSVGRYSIYARGFRTWRLDTATGKTCLFLSTEADWKKLETQAQACP